MTDLDRLRELRDHEEVRRFWTGLGIALATSVPIWVAFWFLIVAHIAGLFT